MTTNANLHLSCQVLVRPSDGMVLGLFPLGQTTLHKLMGIYMGFLTLGAIL